jgi:alkanesulfonate monooxygenase SsuD/methylene tetrahydromethanopterin reductase-like flavin-dependent oxidoreductase (luciferase family)
MKAGLTLPQGCDREYAGLDAETAWERTVDLARRAEEVGFGSLWIYDHFLVDPPPEDAIVFEPFVEAAALSAVTTRAQIGFLVLCAAYRPAALTAKMISTLDVVSGGRAVLGLGAGWKQDEWLAFGYGFPDARTRLAILRDHLEVVTRMLGPGPASYAGEHASVIDALTEPKGIRQPRIPIIVGGNGPEVTWRLAARFADELCLDGLDPDGVRNALPIVRRRCEEIGRDPATLRVSLHFWGGVADAAGTRRQDRMGEYAELSLDRLVLQGFRAVSTPDTLDLLAEDCGAVGLLELSSRELDRSDPGEEVT